MPTTFANTINGNEIYAKRAEQDKDGNQIDTTYAKLNDIPTDVVPAVTSSDDGKVLKANYSGGQGSYSWQTESGGGGSVNDVEVNGSSVVNAQGVAEITIPAQEQSDWAESDNTDPSYIQNKPTEKNLVAGDGISIATSSSSVTISATNKIVKISTLTPAATAVTDINAALIAGAKVIYEYDDGQGTYVELPLCYWTSSQYVFAGWVSSTRVFSRTLDLSNDTWEWSGLTKRTI